MDVVYATQTCSVAMPHGGQTYVQEGTHWPANDPLVTAHPDLFSTDPTVGLTYSRTPAAEGGTVEQATAAPGERRQVRRSESRG